MGSRGTEVNFALLSGRPERMSRKGLGESWISYSHWKILPSPLRRLCTFLSGKVGKEDEHAVGNKVLFA